MIQHKNCRETKQEKEEKLYAQGRIMATGLVQRLWSISVALIAATAAVAAVQITLTLGVHQHLEDHAREGEGLGVDAARSWCAQDRGRTARGRAGGPALAGVCWTEGRHRRSDASALGGLEFARRHRAPRR